MRTWILYLSFVLALACGDSQDQDGTACNEEAGVFLQAAALLTSREQSDNIGFVASRALANSSDQGSNDAQSGLNAHRSQTDFPDIMGALKSAGDALGDAVSSAVKGVVDALKEAGQDLETAVLRPLLGDLLVDNFKLPGSQTERNVKVGLFLGGMLLVVLLGLVADAFAWRGQKEDGTRPSLTTFVVLIASYGFLVPGLLSPLVSFVVGFEALGLKIALTNVNGVHGVISESTFGLISLLLDTGGILGAFLLILYALVVPGLKILLLIWAELWRNSANVQQVRTSRNFIFLVQFISKWASPDMFAYILLLYLFRHLNGDPIVVRGVLGVGFTCFSIFCVGSTLVTLAIQAPEQPGEDAKADHTPPIAVRWLGLEWLHLVTFALFLCFCGVFLYGLLTPCMEMHLNSGLLPSGAEAILKVLNLNLEDKVKAEVTFISATRALAGYAVEGELNDIVAVVMLFGFAMLLPFLDMCLLCWISVLMSRRPAKVETAWNVTRVARWLKHSGMLDVAVMGVIVVTCAGAAYAEQGVAFSLLPGVWVLVAAEGIHYITYYLVHDAVIWQLKQRGSSQEQPGSS